MPKYYDRPRDRADCTVRALAAACDVEYMTAFRAMADAGRQRGRGANTRKMMNAAKALGYEMTEINRGLAKTWTTAKRHFPNGNFVIRKATNRGGHVAGMRDGDIKDWGRDRQFPLSEIFKVKRYWTGRGSQRDLFVTTREAA